MITKLSPAMRINDRENERGKLMKNLMMRNLNGMGSVMLVVFSLMALLLVAAPAAATTTDVEHIVCTGSTSCASGATTLVTTSSSGTFGLINQGGAVTGTAFVVVIEPNGTFSIGTIGTTVGTFTLQTNGILSSGTLGAFLNDSLNDYTFASLASASLQAGITATQFEVQEYQATTGYTGGSGTSNFVTCCSFTGLPVGTILMSFVEESNGDVIQTPLSGSLTTGVPVELFPVPEPSALLLLGSGLVGLGVWGLKKGRV